MWCNKRGMEQLAKHLEETGQTQAGFAEKIGIHASVLCKYLTTGVRPSLDTAVKIEKATGGAVPVSSWFRGQ